MFKQNIYGGFKTKVTVNNKIICMYWSVNVDLFKTVKLKMV